MFLLVIERFFYYKEKVSKTKYSHARNAPNKTPALFLSWLIKGSLKRLMPALT